MEILSVQDLSFSYPEEEKKALRGISLRVEEGEFLLLCGPSGCGKTTFLRLLKRELAPHGQREGSICYAGVPEENLEQAVEILRNFRPIQTTSPEHWKKDPEKKAGVKKAAAWAIAAIAVLILLMALLAALSGVN